MSKQIEALKLALEALKLIDEAMPFPVAKLAQAAIREALAEQPGIECDCETATSPDGSRLTKCGSDQMRRAAQEGHAFRKQPAQQQEPVAVVKALPMGHNQTDMHYAECQHLQVGTPLYTSPPASKPWVGLTEQEHTDIAIQCGCMSEDWVFYGATVERILKEKNS